MKKLLFFILAVLSVNAFATLVTFEVSMKGSGIDYDSIFVVGSHTDWEFVEMEDQGDSLFSVTLSIPENDTAVYYFITIGYWASDYLDYRETVPAECDDSEELKGWEGDRAFIVGAEPMTVSYIWGTCEAATVPTFLNNNPVLSEELRLYPNPAQDLLHISFDGQVEITSIDIVDISGRKIYSGIYRQQEVLLDISQISSGAYILQVYSGEKMGIKQLIIE